MYEASSLGNTVLNSLWFHFSGDGEAFGRDGQYMWSDNILFTPVLTKGSTSVVGYFPKGVWYSLFDYSVLISTGKEFVLETPLTSTNVHVRGGHVIPMQQFAFTTSAVRESNFTLLVALDTEQKATGSLYLDDVDNGDGVDKGGAYSYVKYNVDKSIFQSHVASSVIINDSKRLSYVEKIIVLGIRYLQDCDEILSCSCTGSVLLLPSNQIIAASITLSPFPFSYLQFDFGPESVIPVSSNYSVFWTCQSDVDTHHVVTIVVVVLIVLSICLICCFALFPLFLNNEEIQYVSLENNIGDI